VVLTAQSIELRHAETSSSRKIDQFSLVDVARKVEGVGSVGTRCFIVLFKSVVGMPLFPQFNHATQSRVRTQERQRGTMSANLILQAIDNAAADMRVAMTQKYNVDF
jgi:hypothetical protein